MGQVDLDLLEAAKQGSVKLAREALLKGANIDAQTDAGRTALHITSSYRSNSHFALLKLLVKSGANLELASKGSGTPLMKAANMGNARAVAFLLDNGANVDSRFNSDSDKFKDDTALMLAVEAGSVETARVIIKKGAKINLQNDRGQTALHIASSKANDSHLKLVELLVESGADLELAGKASGTPLMKAANTGNAKIVAFLLDHGANVNARFSGDAEEFKGHTALMFAAEAGSVETAKVIIKKGAKINLQNDRGQTALHIASSEPNDSLLKLVELLVESGADLELASKSNGTPLIKAADSGNTKIVAFLLDHGANINAKLNYYNALMLAIESGHPDTAKVLIERGAEPYQGTALDFAYEQRSRDVIRYCLYDTNLKAKFGVTDLEIAIFNEDIAQVTHLLELHEYSKEEVERSILRTYSVVQSEELIEILKSRLSYPLLQAEERITDDYLPTALLIHGAGNISWNNLKVNQMLDVVSGFDVNIVSIGDGVKDPSYELLKRKLALLKDHGHSNLIVYVNAHGKARRGSHRTDLTERDLNTEDLVSLVKLFTYDRPINLFLDSCHSGAFASAARALLPEGSKAYMVASKNETAKASRTTEMIYALTQRELYQYPLSGKLLMALYLNSVDNYNVSPVVVSVDQKLSYTLTLRNTPKFFKTKLHAEFKDAISNSISIIESEFSDIVCNGNANCHEQIGSIAQQLASGTDLNDIPQEHYGKALGIFMVVTDHYLNNLSGAIIEAESHP